MSASLSPQLTERIPWILDPARIEAEERAFHKDPDAYIEKRFAELSAWDFEVWCRINVKITTKDGKLIPFRFNRVQRHLWRLILEDMAAGRITRMMVIKARQMGVSSLLLALFLWLTSLKPNRNAITICQDQESTHNFSSRLRSFLEEGLELLTPPTKTERRDQIHFANPTARGTGSGERKRRGAGLDSRIMFIPCKRPGIGRSYTFQYAHLSEVAFWSDMKPRVSIKDKMGALAHAIPNEAGTCVFLETTPNGLNEAAEVWQEATKGTNGYRPVFLSYASFEDYRAPLREGETLELCASEELSGQSTRYGNEKAESKIIKDELKRWYPDFYERWGDDWLEHEVLARLNWRRHHIDTACNGDKKVFRREFPLTAGQGFEATSRNCFDLQSLALMSKIVEDEGVEPMRFQYIHDPAIDDPKMKFKCDEYGPLVVYEKPEPKGLYVIGADVALGVPNGDPSALVVLKVEGDILKEVASYNQVITPDQFAAACNYLGLLFNEALLGVENNERGGFAVNLKLHKEFQYPRLYYRFDHYDKKAAAQPGFVTKATNKALLVTGLSMRIRDHEIILRTPLLVDQLEHYVDLGGGELGAQPGWHDDLVSAAMIAVNLTTKVHETVVIPAPPTGSLGWMKKKGILRRGGGRYAS